MNQSEFLEKVTPEPFSGCWLWTGALRNADGYGKAYLLPDKKWVGAHRLAWTLWKGEIPQGLCVLHHCDTPLCVNPAHLFLGDQRTNNQDAMIKGRHKHRLTIAQVLAIRESPKSLRQLAKEYGVSYRTVHSVRTGETWNHV